MIGGSTFARYTSIGMIGLASLVLSVTFGSHAALATDTSVSAFSASAANSDASASTSYTLDFTTTADLAPSTVIAVSMIADLGTLDLSAVTGSSITSSTLPGTGSVTTFGEIEVLEFTLSSFAPAGVQVITITNVTNPSTSDSITVSLSTTGTAGFTTGATSTDTVTIGEGTGDGGGENGGDGGFGGSASGDNTVTVTVTDADGAPLQSQIVVGYCGGSFDQASTDSSGVATLENLANGNCGVQLNTSGGYYSATQFFTFVQSDTPQSEEIAMTATTLDTSVDISVTDTDGSPVDSLYLTLVDQNGREFSGATSDGLVTISLDYGTYSVIAYYDDDTQYLASTSVNVTTDASTQNIDLQLTGYSSFIEGTVTDSEGTALGSPRLLIISDGGDISFHTGNEDGTYSLGVVPGVYTVKAESTGYANGAKRGITVLADHTKTGQDIALDTADNTLNISIVDSEGAADTTVTGGVMCKDPGSFDPISIYFGFLSDGTTSFQLPDVTVQCNLFTSGYATNSPTFTLSGGETQEGQITVTSYDSTVIVSLVDEEGNPVNDARFGVFGETNSGGKTLEGFSMGGETSIGAAAGTYTLRTYMMSGSYATDFTTPTVVTLVAGEQTTVTITVYGKTGVLSGTIVDSNGDPVDGATITALSTNSTKPFSFSTTTDENGDYSMDVVPSTYTVTAAKEGVDNLPAIPQTAKVKDGITKTIDASLEKTNASLVVTPIQSSESEITSGSCYAFEPDGTYVSADLDGASATLAVNPGEWHYGCRVLIGDKEYTTKSEGVVTMIKGDTTQVETTITSGGTGFQNVVYQFSATADATLTLPDGTTIFVPANTLDTTGNVSIVASSADAVGVDDNSYPLMPLTLEAHDSNGVLITGTFNGQITITFHYTQHQLNTNGVSEDDLQGESFKNDAWASTDQGYTVKKGADYVSITTTHFSTFGLVAPIQTPRKVKDITTKKITTTSARLTWTAPAKSKVETYTTQLRLFNNTHNNTWSSFQGLTSTFKAVTALTPGAKYQYRVKACNSTGCSAYSDWQSFTTKSATGS